ncbi:hypothetical protein RUMGNA_01676 [Mediterraneibacter gnavus ATCC 29149]|uniref:Uncharacterized protein n=1 Tax=Mediterraneibacter gnavus (strain ATCC 29149 / DSM 114966 / JCM 6515 / VPI C7-9) TaxID=411470 RepID=A7B298_MEDG7|nr:hypothetical protein RUMGNA_01676 [Mediterraneibacter gnavus ATCC 29149]
MKICQKLTEKQTLFRQQSCEKEKRTGLLSKPVPN